MYIVHIQILDMKDGINFRADDVPSIRYAFLFNSKTKKLSGSGQVLKKAGQIARTLSIS